MSGISPSDNHKGDPQALSGRSESSQPVPRQPTIQSIEVSHLDGQPAQPLSSTPQWQSPAQPFFRVPESPRSNATETRNAAAKVAIPRLRRDVDSSDLLSERGHGRHRVNHACEPCRHRKTKCSGERPVCKHCQDFKIVCFYADGKRDRVKKQFGTMTEKVADYEKLLRSLIDKVPVSEAQQIRASLDRVTQSELDEGATDTATIASVEVTSENETSGGAESEASAGAGSTGALDRTDEDFTREGARETGFIGKNSEITWMQRLRQENKFGEEAPPGTDKRSVGADSKETMSMHSQRHVGDQTVPLPEAADGFTIHESSYHLDDVAISTFEAVDPYEMPTVETAQLLFSTYMQRVHPSFPIVGQVNLTAQFQRYLANSTQKPPENWLAIVNLIFAISAKYSHLIQADWKGDERDHLIYFSRARMLGIDQDVLFVHPDLQHIQIIGLMSFYLLCTGQINRSWTLAGHAIRASCAVGLNMRNESTNLKDSLKEIRYRLWWSLYTLEHRLCSITGRVNCVIDDHCTTPLPIPLEEDKFDSYEAKQLLTRDNQRGVRAPSSNVHSPSVPASTPSEKRSSSNKSESSRSPTATQQSQNDLEWAKDVTANSSLYFLHLVQLTRLTQSIFHNLYNPASIEGSWSYIQSQIEDLNASLEGWYRNLPSIFDFRRKQRDRDFYEFRLSLGFAYYGTKQMIFRPCLCRLDRKIPGQSSKSNEFNRFSATSCVEAAQDTMRLIPDEPNAVGLISVGPWWSILQWLVQAATVLMLELSFRAHHMPEDADAILESAKKAIRWLHALGEDNLSAKRAWTLCNPLLHDAAKRIGREIKDVPDRTPGRFSVSSERTYMSNYANMHMSSRPTGAGIFNGGFGHFDTMMQYDQYFPGMSNVALPGGEIGNYDTQLNDNNMEYMSSAYHDQQGNEGPNSGGTQYS